MAQDTLLGFPAHTLPFRCGESTSLSTASSPASAEAGLFAMQKHSKIEMCYFSAPAGQPEIMHKNFMHQHLHVFVGRYSCMKFRARILQIRR